jgi:hypothetical protein
VDEDDDEDRRRKAGHWGWAAGFSFFSAVGTLPIAGTPVPDDCLGCGDERAWVEWMIYPAVVFCAAVAMGSSVRSIATWLLRRRGSTPETTIEPPGLAISTATMLVIFAGIWAFAIIWS